MLRSVTGPDDCRTHAFYSAGVGSSLTRSVQVTDADGADGQIVGFYYGVLTDDATYEGVLHDGMFSAASVPPSMVEVLGNCVAGGATETFTFSYTLTGSFSTDRKHLTATEIWIYQTADFVQTFTFDWAGNAP